MRQVISESELGSIDLKQFHEVIAVKDAGDYQGVAVYVTPRMAQFVDPSVPAKETITNSLLIVVDNPDDLETIERLKKLVVPQRITR